MADLHEIEKHLKEFENILREFYRQNPVHHANTLIKKRADEFNDWIKRNVSELEAKHLELQRLIESTDTLEAKITDMDQKLEQLQSDVGDSSSISRYRHLAAERNSLAQKYNKLVQECEQNNDLYNQNVNEFNQEQEKHRTDIEEFQRNLAEKVEEYNKWIKEDGPLQFFNQVNILYATLIQEIRRDKCYELEGHLDRLRHIRRELGEHTKTKHDRSKQGGHIVRATLCQSEECYFVVSKASMTSITPEMVDILGIRQHVGEEVEIRLADASKTKKPQLVIPKITVNEFEADYVKAVVIQASEEGVDGCIGYSFLNKFDYVIDNKGLLLKPLQPVRGDIRFDVFICHKSDDFSAASEVFDLLTESGYRPFLSEVSLAECGTTDYQKAIDAALEGTEHLVLVASSCSNIETPWVEAEWRSFESLKRSGKKHGNIVPVVCGDITVDELPLALSRYQILSMDDPNWKVAIINYLPRS